MIAKVGREHTLDLPDDLVGMRESVPVRGLDVAPSDGGDHLLVLANVLPGQLVVEGLVVEAQDTPPVVEQPGRQRMLVGVASGLGDRSIELAIDRDHAERILSLDGACILRLQRSNLVEIARAMVLRGQARSHSLSPTSFPLASPGIVRRAPRWLFDPLGPLSVRPAYLPRITPWLWRVYRASSPSAFRHSMQAQVELMRLARSETLRLVETAKLHSLLRSDGNLELYELAAELDAARPSWDAREKEGIAFRYLVGDALAELQPGLSPRFTHATFVPGWQSVSDPYDYARALWERVADVGAVQRRGNVCGISADADGVTLDLGEGVSLRTRHVVVAAGAWSKPLAAMMGDHVPLDTERGYNTTLPADAFNLKRQLTFGGHGFVVTRLSGGIRVGGAVEFAGLDRAPRFRRSQAMLAKAKSFLPGLQAEGGRQWMGFRPSMPVP